MLSCGADNIPHFLHPVVKRSKDRKKFGIIYGEGKGCAERVLVIFDILLGIDKCLFGDTDGKAGSRGYNMPAIC
jgi:hypothetical protein